MKKLGIILTGLLIVLIGLWLIPVFRVSNLNKEDEKIQQRIYQSQKSEQNEVSVEATPLSLKADANLQFKVVLDTHTIELNYDLRKISKLNDDKDRNYQPLSWTGGSGGHHLSGELTFPAISKNVKSIELVIFNVEGADRRFKWDL